MSTELPNQREVVQIFEKCNAMTALYVTFELWYNGVISFQTPRSPRRMDVLKPPLPRPRPPLNVGNESHIQKGSVKPNSNGADRMLQYARSDRGFRKPNYRWEIIFYCQRPVFKTDHITVLNSCRFEILSSIYTSPNEIIVNIFLYFSSCIYVK